jgi:hypothetical protein
VAGKESRLEAATILRRPEATSPVHSSLLIEAQAILVEPAPQLRQLAVFAQQTPTQSKSLDALCAAARKRGVEVREMRNCGYNLTPTKDVLLDPHHALGLPSASHVLSIGS